MASSYALSFLPLTQSPKLCARNPLPNSRSWRPRPPRPNAPSSSYISASIGDGPNATEPITVETLHRFFELSVGKWHGSFYQFNAHGKLMQNVSTRLSASTYGEDDLMSLIQTLYIKQPPLSVSDPEEDPEWAEYKIKETNMFTVDRYQQIGLFPDTRAFALRYQTAGMLETVLRQGVLGENDTGEESPRNLKLPSRRPSIVCENCLYAQDIDNRRARAFHVMNPGGDLDMLLVFLEDRGDGNHPPPSLANLGESAGRVEPFLGRWEGHSMTKRSGVYGSTLTEADCVSLLEMNNKGQLIQDITSTSRGSNVATKVHWSGTLVDNLIIYDGGYQITLLPGGMYMGCPCDVAKSVAESKSFHLEFCWLESPGKRQRLVRTYDVEGLAVSSTYFSETKSLGL
ncbi:unnamed protein product [Linum trigynum]|uniref:DUF3598 domain-containing protein n=1 Tax=Linum trigynum TaxID=586398 RepID=A0AAV2F3C5_9ROSI